MSTTDATRRDGAESITVTLTARQRDTLLRGALEFLTSDLEVAARLVRRNADLADLAAESIEIPDMRSATGRVFADLEALDALGWAGRER